MKSTSLRVIFMGTPEFAGQILEALARTVYRPTLVISEPARAAGRHQQLADPAVVETARALKLPVDQPVDHPSLLSTIQTAEPDLGIVVAYGRILKPDVLSIPKYGFVNIHYSLLPKYRGASPVQAALLAGDPATGVTIIQIDADLDTGPILAQSEVPIDLDDTTATLLTRLSTLAVPLLIETLDRLTSGTLTPEPQPLESPTPVTRKITKDQGRLTGQESPEQICRMLRAYTPWPGVWFELGEQRILLKAAHSEHQRLIPLLIQLPGKQPLRWADVVRDRPRMAESILSFLNPT